MLAYLQIMLSFAAVCVLCLFVARAGWLPSGLAPLPVAGGIMVLLVAGGYLGFLKPAAALVFCAALFALGHMAATARRGGFRRLFTPGFVLFFVGGMAFLTLFAVRQPMAQGWDEFSLWATAAKLTKLNNVIFSEAPMGWAWIGTQKPGLPTFGYFFNFFGEYAAWRLYGAYAVLYVAVWAAMLGNLRWKQWTLCVPAALCAFLLPYFTVYVRDIYPNFLYIDSYADFPMGVFAAGILAWYFWAKRSGTQCWPICVALAALTLYKDTGLALGCIVAAIIYGDLLFAGSGEKLLCGKSIARKTAFFGGMLASVGGTYLASSRYLASLLSTAAPVGEAVVRTEEMSPVTMVIEGVRALLGLAPGASGAPYAEKFATIKSQMLALFLPGEGSRVTMIGCGLYVMLLVFALLGGAALLTKERLWRRSALLYGVFSTLGFVLYYTFIGFTYVYIFKDGITDYNRYINTYYLLWLGGALALLVQCAVAGSRKNLLTLGTLCVSLVFLLRFNQMVQRQLCFIDYPDVTYNSQKEVEARANVVKAQLAEGDKVFYVHTNDDGHHWFENSYELLPHILVYSHGGGPLQALYGAGITPEELAAELAAQGCAYVFVDHADADFMSAYGSLFADGGAAALAGETLLYKVEVSGTPEYTPVTPDMVRNPEKELRSDGTVKNSEEGQRNQFMRVVLTNMAECFTLTPVEMEVPTA